jgi:hypothetical protein
MKFHHSHTEDTEEEEPQMRFNTCNKDRFNETAVRPTIKNRALTVEPRAGQVSDRF